MAGNSSSQNQGSGERGLAPACCQASLGGCTFPPRLYGSCWDPAPRAIVVQPMPSGLRPWQRRVCCYCCRL